MTTTFLTDYFSILDRCKNLLATEFTPVVWSPKKEYSTNSLIVPTVSNGSYYRCILAGISDETEPVWSTSFWSEKTDGTVKWRQEDPVYILDNEPVDFSYPCVILRDIEVMSEIQQAIGNQPMSTVKVTLSVIAYQGAPTTKTFLQTRAQCYDVLKQVKNVIRKYPNLNSFEGVLSATAGIDTLDETVDKVFFKIGLLWIIKLLSKKS